MTRRAKRPLNEDAMAKANAAIYDLTDPKGRKLDPNSKADAALRDKWMDAYIAAGGELEGDSSNPKPPSDPVLPCPLCEEAYLVVMVTDYDGKPIENAAVNVAGVGPMSTDINGLADYGEVEPDAYNIAAGKEGYWPTPYHPFGGLAEITESVAPNSTVVAYLKLFLSGEPVEPVMPPEPEEEPGITIRASLFFDGTLNNRINSDMGEQLIYWPLNDSYTNDWSNVAKLEFNCIKSLDLEDYFFPIYIEGIGTTTGSEDNARGTASGTGITGVTSKVSRAIDLLINKINADVGEKQIEYLHLDVFGFSRGAAAARYCIYAAQQILMDRLVALGYSVGSIEVIFAGLFDTVASFGLDFSDDTEDLHLDAIKHAKSVVHLCAAEEHRKNFSLTNIDSSIRAGRGKQFFLPGVHSDVGGGYAQNYNENLILYKIKIPFFEFFTREAESRIQRERNWLVNFGWYADNEMTIYKDGVSDEFMLIADKKKISNKYALIPLHIMIGYATGSNLKFSPVEEIPKELQAAYKVITEEYIPTIERNNDLSHLYHWSANNSEWHRKLRHEFFHFSAYYGVVISPHAPHFTNDDPIDGIRDRIIRKG